MDPGSAEVSEATDGGCTMIASGSDRHLKLARTTRSPPLIAFISGRTRPVCSALPSDCATMTWASPWCRARAQVAHSGNIIGVRQRAHPFDADAAHGLLMMVGLADLVSA